MIRRHTLPLTFIAFASLMFFSTRDAAAQDAQAPYVVVTNDGSTYEGQLVENVVGQHVTIRIATGELRTIQASEVKSQGSVGATATVTQPMLPFIAPIAGLPGGPPIAYTGPDAVQIHVTKADNSEGTLLGETASGWQPVCTMPCTTTVDPKVDYKLHNSDPFRFPAGHSLDLVAESSGRRTYSTIGWTLIGISLVAWIPGLLFQVGAFSNNATPRTPAEMQQQSAQQGTNMAIGLVFDGASAAMLVAGIIFTALHPSGTLSTTSGQRLVKLGIPLSKKLTLTPAGLVF
jgi:hypothetical protein